MAADPVVRFETAPGVQMQADFTTIRRGQYPLKALVPTLGFSRATFVRFTAREDSETVLSCLSRCRRTGLFVWTTRNKC